MAANLESLGKNDEALSTYQRLATEYPQSFNAPLALLAEVPLLKAKNRNDEARRVCETIISQYRDSIVANEAMRELISLPKPAAPPMANAGADGGAHPDGPATRTRSPAPAVKSKRPERPAQPATAACSDRLRVRSCGLTSSSKLPSGERDRIIASRTGSACARPAGRTSSAPSSADRG